jgi:hypothetical protein
MTQTLAPSSDRPARTAGRGLLLAGLAYLAQPILVFTLYAANEGDRAEHLVAWQGVLGAAVFVAVAAGLALGVLAVDQLVAAPTAGTALTRVAGLAGAGGWLLTGGLAAARGGSRDNLVATTADPVLQGVVLHGVDTATIGALCVAAIGSAGWLVGLGTALRRAGTATVAQAVIALVAAAVVVVPLLLWSAPFGLVVLIPVLPLLGVTFLRRRS